MPDLAPGSWMAVAIRGQRIETMTSIEEILGWAG